MILGLVGVQFARSQAGPALGLLDGRHGIDYFRQHHAVAQVGCSQALRPKGFYVLPHAGGWWSAPSAGWIRWRRLVRDHDKRLDVSEAMSRVATSALLPLTAEF